ncbi:MAG: menaquinone biosynthetic enzyme MqnA/MqnD family protein [Candidatus Saccharimonadales bacterium]
MPNISHKIRLGAVSYLNTKPLIYRLSELAPQAELVLDVPSRLADDLATGKLDVALIPSIEYFQDASYTIVSDACIACRGPVLSVKLFSRVPVEKIGTLALDEGSRTSVALVRILLKQQFGLAPRLEPLSLGSSVGDSAADAVLVIGDRAMHSPGGPFAAVWDLGDEWRRWAELPFVFAMWVARPGVEFDELADLLAQARDVGLANLAEIAAVEAAPLGLSHPQCVAYLRDNLYFYLGPRERAGLERFRQLAQELDHEIGGARSAKASTFADGSPGPCGRHPEHKTTEEARAFADGSSGPCGRPPAHKATEGAAW